MGWGKALSAVVVMSISVMLVVSVLPVGASHIDGTIGKCNGPWSPITVEGAHYDHDSDASGKDKNGNHYVCWKMTGNGVYQYRDDRPIK